jgi:NNP family nitrate/nitrite transporter-like MFS transporter
MPVLTAGAGGTLADVSGQPAERAQRNLVVATAAFALCFTAWGLLAPLARKFEDDWGLSSFETSVIVAIPVVLGSVLRIPVGALTDRYGGRLLFAAIMLLSAPPALLLGYVDSYWALVVTGFLLGISGSSFAAGVPFVAGWYAKERQGFAIGVYGMGNVGTAVAAFGAPAIVEWLGRPALGWIAAIVLVLAAGAVWATAQDPERRGPSARYREMLRSGWPLWRLSLFYFVTFGGFVAMAVFLPKLLRDWFDLSLVDAGLRAAGFTLVATFARPLGGWLSDRAGATAVLVVAFAGIGVDAAALAALSADPSIVPVTVACLTLAAFLGAGNGAVFKLVPHEFPTATGAATGIVGAAGGLGGFFPPLVMGVVKDATDSYAIGFLGLVAFCAVCLWIAVRLWRSARPLATA